MSLKKYFEHITKQDLAVAGLLIAFGFLMRVVPHMPNFSPMIGIALFSGYYFRRSLLFWAVPVATMVATDAAIGFYAIMPVVWLSYVLMSVFAKRFVRRGTVVESAAAGLGGSVLFFVVTNFAVWAQGQMYAMTWSGLVDCFVAAVPFFRSTLLSGIVYSMIFFGIAELYAKRVQHLGSPGHHVRLGRY